MILALTFLSRSRLWLLLLVAALIAAYVVMQLRRKEYAVRFTNLALLDSIAPKRPGWRRHVPAAAFVLAMIALVTAFAQPARPVKVPRERATIVMAIDVSLSMEATDVEPNRILAARHQVLAVEVVDPRELELPNVGYLTLVDPETGRRMELQTAKASIRQRYAEAAAAQRAEIAATIRRSGAQHLVLRTDRDWLRDIVDFVLSARRRRGGLRPAVR